MASVEFRQVVKQYAPGQPFAVDQLDLLCSEGEMLALLGPSGCGKSSTLKMAAGLEELTSGEILFGSRPISRLTPAERNIAMVFEDYCLYPNLTIEENIAFPLNVRAVPAAEQKRRVQDVLSMLGLSGMGEKRVHDLSGGAQQRVAIGRALVRDPDLILFDEPLSHLDGDQKIHLRAEISRLQKSRGVTSILVTHDQTEATAMADRIAIMHNGKLQQVATPGELYARPANVFVANFIGEPPMNLFTGTFRQESHSIAIGIPGVRLEVSPERQALLSQRHSGELIVGVRPEHVAVKPASGGEAAATVTYRETRGDTDTLTLRTTGQEPIVFVSELEGPSAFRMEDPVTIAIKTADVHLFDPETEENLELGG